MQANDSFRSIKTVRKENPWQITEVYHCLSYNTSCQDLVLKPIIINSEIFHVMST